MDMRDTQITLSAKAEKAWAIFLATGENRGHVRRELIGGSLERHVGACYEAAIETADRIGRLAMDRSPRHILEVGCSSGLNCLALAAKFPSANVIGVDPEAEAVTAAAATAESLGETRTVFLRAVGESLPIADGSIDLIVCHTVIEHVRNVEKVIAEMARVLAPGGVISLEAPNYVWPWEPHLEMWCVPLFGKHVLRLLARLYGRTDDEVNFLNHLQLVSPGRLEKCFQHEGLTWRDNVREKIMAAGSGQTDVVKGYRRIVPLLHALRSVGLLKLTTELIIATRMYPSMLYTLTKARA